MLFRSKISLPLLTLMVPPLALNANQLMQGPMVGAIDSNGATIWARVAGEKALRIRYSERPSFSESKNNCSCEGFSPKRLLRIHENRRFRTEFLILLSSST